MVLLKIELGERLEYLITYPEVRWAIGHKRAQSQLACDSKGQSLSHSCPAEIPEHPAPLWGRREADPHRLGQPHLCRGECGDS
jgi:hypothetical protein